MHSAEEPARSVDRHTTVAGDRIDDDGQSPGDESRHLLADDSAEPHIPDSISTAALRKHQRSRQGRRRIGRGSMESVEDKKFDSIIHTVPEDQQLSTKKSTRYRWIVIFILSISGDGWSYEASVMSSVLNMPQFIARESRNFSISTLHTDSMHRHGIWRRRRPPLHRQHPHRTHLLVSLTKTNPPSTSNH